MMASESPQSGDVDEVDPGVEHLVQYQRFAQVHRAITDTRDVATRSAETSHTEGHSRNFSAFGIVGMEHTNRPLG